MIYVNESGQYLLYADYAHLGLAKSRTRYSAFLDPKSDGKQRNFTTVAFERRVAGRLVRRRGIPFWIWLPMSHSLDIPKAERSRYFSETDIISAGCGFSSRTYLPRIFKLKEGCTPTECWEKMAEKVTPEDKKQD